MHFSTKEWPYILIVALVIVLEWIHVIYIFRSLNKNLIKNYETKEHLKDFKASDKLYKSYRQLSPYKFKMVKLSLESVDYSHGPINQMIEFFTKIIMVISIALMGYTVSTSSALLSYLNSNKEELRKNNPQGWIDDISGIIDNLKNGFAAYQFYLFTGLLLFIIATNHIMTSSVKQRIQKRHLTIIKEVEKEMN